MNKISICKFKPLDLEKTKTEVQLLSKTPAVEIIANRPSHYYSDAKRIKILDADEIRNQLAKINFLKNTRYKPTNYKISFNYLDNPKLQKRLEEGQGRLQFDISTPMVPPYGRIVYDYTNTMWIPTAAINPQSQSLKGRRKQSRVDILDWTLEIKEVSIILN